MKQANRNLEKAQSVLVQKQILRLPGPENANSKKQINYTAADWSFSKTKLAASLLSQPATSNLSPLATAIQQS